MILQDMIYQGTVWGPWLWNIFYEDARLALQFASFLAVVFADDLNALRPFPLNAPNKVVIRTAEECQQELHKWGRANQVQFDPGKESLHVISHHCPAGSNFKILGVSFDCRLTMQDAISGLTSEMRWRVRSVLRTQRYHTTASTIQLYKSKVLSYCEYRTAAIYHACTSLLQIVDRVQERFLEEIGIDDVTAFCDFNLAPLALRRDIAMLGLVHRTVLCQGPSHFQQWFYVEHNGNRRSSRRRGQASRLHEYRDGTQLNIVKRSALGLCSIYNLLPESIVEDKSVKGFQRSLQDLARECARQGFPDWQYLYSTRHMLHIHPLRRI